MLNAFYDDAVRIGEIPFDEGMGAADGIFRVILAPVFTQRGHVSASITRTSPVIHVQAGITPVGEEGDLGGIVRSVLPGRPAVDADDDRRFARAGEPAADGWIVEPVNFSPTRVRPGD